MDDSHFEIVKLFYEMETDQPISYLVYDKFLTKLAEIEKTDNLISYTEVKKKLSELKDIYQKIFDQIEKIHNKLSWDQLKKIVYVCIQSGVKLDVVNQKNIQKHFCG